MAVRRDHHGDLDALGPESGNAPSPFSFDEGTAFESQAKLGEKRDCGIERFDHNADVVHPLNTHVVRLLLGQIQIWDALIVLDGAIRLVASCCVGQRRNVAFAVEQRREIRARTNRTEATRQRGDETPSCQTATRRG